MSHVVTIKAQLKDLAVLRKTFERLGGTFTEGQTTYRWWNRHEGDYPLPQGFSVADLGKCHHAVKFPGVKYEVGIVEIDKLPEGHSARTLLDEQGKRVYPDGTFVPILDFIDSQLNRIMGGVEVKKGDWQALKFMQAYAVEKAKRELEKRKYRVEEEQREDGSIKLTASSKY